MDRAHLRKIIQTRLDELELSAKEASIRAVGNAALIANIGRERYGMPSVEKLERLAEVLELEFYFGPKRDIGPVETLQVDGDDYAHIPLHEATLAAGDGAENGAEPIIDHLAFKRSWLKRIGVSPSSAVLARVANGKLGQSMWPTISPGDMVLIDTSRREIPRRPADQRKGPIYAFTTEDGARVKRITQVDDIIVLVSDNPEVAPEFIPIDRWGGINVIGKVVWWGHTAEE